MLMVMVIMFDVSDYEDVGVGVGVDVGGGTGVDAGVDSYFVCGFTVVC